MVILGQRAMCGSETRKTGNEQDSRSGRKRIVEGTVSNRKNKWFYMAVSALFFVLAAWLYCQEGPWVKVMELNMIPEDGRFEVDLLADGRHIRAMTQDESVRLFVDESQAEGMTRVMIYGECESGRQEPVRVKVTGDCEETGQTWKYRVVSGTAADEPVVDKFPNAIRKWYLIMTGLLWVLGGIGLSGGRKTRQQKELEDYGSRILELLAQEPGMDQACREGERVFAQFERRKAADLLFVAGAWSFYLFWLLHHDLHAAFLDSGTVWKLMAAGAFLAVAVALALRIGRNTAFVTILTRDCRPVTAATAYLLEGRYGRLSQTARFGLYHNGASGLYRSGHCREALELSRLGWKSLSKKTGDYVTFISSSLQYQCLKVLEETEEAEKEKKRIEGLLSSHPDWKKKKDIQRFLGIQNICRWIETGEIEQAEKSAREILGQWQEGYYRLPVLSLMAELKEYLGKEDEAALLREEILTFSPENKEVRQVMGEGRLRFHWEKVHTGDTRGTVLRILCAAAILVFFLLTACF